MYKLIKVADDFTALSDAEKEALFNNYEQASPSELYDLGKFKIAVESEDETDAVDKVQLTAVPNDILCLPRELFGDSFDKINNVTVTDTIQKNSKTAQKLIENLCRFVNTFRGQGDTIITVKTPQYIIYFLLSP